MAKKAIDKKKQVGKKVEQAKGIQSNAITGSQRPAIEVEQTAPDPESPVHSRESEDGHRFEKQASGKDAEGLYDLNECRLCGKTEKVYRRVPAR